MFKVAEALEKGSSWGIIMRKGDDNLEAFIKSIFPKVIANWPKTPHPDENTLAEFLDGKLKGKRLDDLHSHLLVCQDCTEAIVFLRESMATRAKEIKYRTPQWLHAEVKKLFPAEPKEWEIGLKKLGNKFELISYTGELGLTFPGLEIVSISAGKRLTPEKRRQLIGSIETLSPQLADIVRKVEQMASDLKGVNEQIQRLKDIGEINHRSGKPLLKKRTDLSKLISKIMVKEPSGFFFRDHLEKYAIGLFLTKPQIDTSNFIEIQAGICNLDGKPAEEFEFSLMRGQKTIEKALARPGLTISKRVQPGKFRIKFRHYGIYVGQVTVGFRK